jgi:hypothetical protein
VLDGEDASGKGLNYAWNVLRSYTGHQMEVEAEGATVVDLRANLSGAIPGYASGRSTGRTPSAPTAGTG